MLCKKCGKEISDNSKFCGYCGQLVEKVDSLNSTNNQDMSNQIIDDLGNNNEIVESSNQNLTEVVEENVNTELATNTSLANSNVEIQSVGDFQNNQSVNVSNNSSIKTEFEPLKSSVETPNLVSISTSTKKKKVNRTLLIIIAVILVIAINVFAFIAMNKVKSTKNSISILQKAVGNFEKKGNISGTITAGIQVESSTSDLINLSASILYEKGNDDYKLNIRVNKSAITEEMNLYSIINKDKGTVYVNSKTIDMFGMTESGLDTWLVYTQVFENIKTVIEKETKLNSDIKLDKIIDKEHFKLVGKENGLNHFIYIIDEKLLENIKNNLNLDTDGKKSIDDAIETLKTSKIKKLEFDIYIDNSNEISKISMDLAKIINSNEIKKAELSIEFKDFNSTKVEIPKDALNTTMNIEDYIKLYSVDNEVYDFDLDTNTDLNLNLPNSNM